MLKLIEPEEKYIEGYKEAYDLSQKLINEKVIKPHNSIFTDPYKYNIITKYRDNIDPTKLKEGYVPAYHLIFVDDDIFIGEIWNDKLLVDTKKTLVFINSFFIMLYY